MLRTLSVELLVLCASVGLGLVHILTASHSASLQRGYRWTASARDEAVPPLGGVAGRLARALGNFNETFPYFAALALAIEFTGRHSTLSEWGAIAYLVGRALYLPLYAFGIPVVRSFAWNVATFGVIALLVALLTG